MIDNEFLLLYICMINHITKNFMTFYKVDAFIYYSPGDVRREKIDINCGDKDIVIRIDVCGRCGTDRRLWEKSHPRVATPTVLGHELAGEIVEVGSRVQELTEGIGYMSGKRVKVEELVPGKRVTVQSRIARHDIESKVMLMNDPYQNLSFQVPGAFAKYMKIDEPMIRSGAVLIIPDNVSNEEAALVEPAACALESIFSTVHPVGIEPDGRHKYRSGIKKGGRTIIIGSGTLAMIYGLLAKAEGAGELWYIVRSESKGKMIRKHVGNSTNIKILEDYTHESMKKKLEIETMLEKELSALTDGNLFDDIILAAPSVDAQRYMINLLNPDGYGVCASFAGIRELIDRANIDLLHYRIGKITGTSGCSTRAMETILKWLADGRISMKGLTCPTEYTLNTNPEEFFTTNADGRKPMLYPWK